MQKTVTRLYSSRQAGWDLILRVSRKIHDMFFNLHYFNGKSETNPTIFLKLQQIEVQGYSGTLSDFEENLTFSGYDFSKMDSFETFWPPGAQWQCLSGAPPRRGTLAGGNRRLQLVIFRTRCNL